MRQFNKNEVVVIVTDDIVPMFCCGKVDFQDTSLDGWLSLVPLNSDEREEINSLDINIIKENQQIMLMYKMDVPYKNIKRIYTIYERIVRN